jgi:hypothetical protein
MLAGITGITSKYSGECPVFMPRHQSMAKGKPPCSAQDTAAMPEKEKDSGNWMQFSACALQNF